MLSKTRAILKEFLLHQGLINEIKALRQDVRRNSGYLARQEISALLKAIEPSRLEHFGYKVYSQNDEDGILSEIFRRIGVKTGAFLEIGVENGLECNSLNLIHAGWRGAWIEANINQRQHIEDRFSKIIENKRLSLFIAFVTAENINSIIAAALEPTGIDRDNLDLISIDIDGMDIYIFESLLIKPKVICIEYNSKFPPPINKRPVYNALNVWKGTDYMGSSLTAINDVATRIGYKLVSTNINGANAFFVREDLVMDRFKFELTPENLYNPPRYWLFYDHFSSGIGHSPDFGSYVDLE